MTYILASRQVMIQIIHHSYYDVNGNKVDTIQPTTIIGITNLISIEVAHWTKKN